MLLGRKVRIRFRGALSSRRTQMRRDRAHASRHASASAIDPGPNEAKRRRKDLRNIREDTYGYALLV